MAQPSVAAFAVLGIPCRGASLLSAFKAYWDPCGASPPAVGTPSMAATQPRDETPRRSSAALSLPSRRQAVPSWVMMRMGRKGGNKYVPPPPPLGTHNNYRGCVASLFSAPVTARPASMAQTCFRAERLHSAECSISPHDKGRPRRCSLAKHCALDSVHGQDSRGTVHEGGAGYL